MTALTLLAGLLALVPAAGALFTAAYARRVARRYPPEGAFLDVDGLRVHYLDAGPRDAEGARTVVLLHGASSNLAESMLGMGKALLERGYRVVAFDRPGHGWTGRRRGGRMGRPDRQAAVLAAALRRLEVRGALIVGHSWSGSVAPLLALDHGDVAGALLVLAGVTHPWPGGRVAWYNHAAASWAGWLLTRTVVTPLGLALFPSAAARTFAPQPVPPGFAERARIPLLFRPATFQANAEDVAALFEAVSRQSSRYSEIRIPVTVLGGDADEIVWTDLHSRSFARDVPGARLVVLPDVGHMPQYARPDLVIAEIEALAARAGRAAGRPG